VEVARVSQLHALVISGLSPELAQRITAVAREGDRLVVLTESAAWAARVRFETGTLLAAAQVAEPALKAVEIRVRPPCATAGRSGR